MSRTPEQLAARVRELAAGRLRYLMSEVSEDYCAASWLIGLEYDLWNMVRGGSREFGEGVVPPETVAELRQLSDDCGGWHTHDRLVPLDEWRREYARWWEERHQTAILRTMAEGEATP
jgi:hypothetical protein